VLGREPSGSIDSPYREVGDEEDIGIEKPLGDKAREPKGEEMQDLTAYVKTLVSKPEK